MSLQRSTALIRTSLQRPTLCAFLYPPLALATATRAASVGMNAERKLPSPSVAMKTQASKAGMVNDVGLLPDLFIMPTGKKLPSMFKSPRIRARLEWHRLKSRVKDYLRVLYYRRAMPKPRPALNQRQVPQLAQAMHHQMYTAFAEGDLHTLKQLCCDGLLRSFEGRLMVRPHRRRMRWRVTMTLGRPRVVAHLAAQTGAGARYGLRQAVVRIRTRQALETFDVPVAGAARPRDGASQAAADWNAVVSGQSLDGKGEVKQEDKDEYVVVQRLMRDGVEGEWMVWGTTQENDWRKTLELEA